MNGNTKTLMRDFVYEYYLNKYGLKKMAAIHYVKLLRSLKHHDLRAFKLDLVLKLKSPERISTIHPTFEQCSCGNHFLTDSLFCRKCGTRRPGLKSETVPKLTCKSTTEKCGCGNIYRGDSKFCRRCGHKRPLLPPTRETCNCGNLFMTDSLFCRKCGQKRPGNTDPVPHRVKKCTFHICGCANEFAPDALYCRKCGYSRPHELPHFRFAVFLFALGMKAQRCTEGSEAGDILCMMLRRHFSKNVKSISESLGTEPRECTIPINRAIEMIIGPKCSRNDSSSWVAPELLRVCSISDIESLLKKIENLPQTRFGGYGVVSIILSLHLHVAFTRYIKCM